MSNEKDMTQDMSSRMIIEDNIFPHWEDNIPTLGKKYSQAGNQTHTRALSSCVVESLPVRRQRTASTSGANCQYVALVLRSLRYAACLILLMIMGIGEMWGQDPDYSGTYYIASNYIASKVYKYDPVTLANNYYLCPTEGWAFYVSGGTVTDTDNGQPFITTHKRASGEEAKYKWIVEKHTVEGVDYYTFKYSIDYVDGESTHHTRYMSYSSKISGAGVDRMRVHLEKTESPGDNELFRIVVEGAYLVISPKNTDANDTNKTKYLTVNAGNKDSYQGESGKGNGPSGYPNTAGIIGTYWDITDVNAPFYLEDVITRPAIAYNSSNFIEITDQTGSATDIYYTTDGSTPTTSSTQYTSAFAPAEGVTTIKAVAVVGNEVSNVATFNIDSHQYLIQSVECTDFYMMPGDKDNSNNTTVNTSSLFRSTMAWTFTYAGYEGGIQYYYIKNGENYLFRTSTNIYIKTNSDFEGAADKTGYMFSIGQWYGSDKDNMRIFVLEGYHIIPKGATFNYCIYKGGYDANNSILANTRNYLVAGGEKALESYGRWNIISAPDNKLPASITYDSANPNDANWPEFLSSSTSTKYFKIENVGTAERYMSPPDGTAYVGTATTGSNELAWYVIEAGHDDWQKYYYIVHAATGKYMKFNQTIPATPSDMSGKSNVLSLLDYDSSASDRYQFVFAKSTIEGAYYIVPKGLEDATYNNYYALYLDATSASTLEQPIKSTKSRQSDSYKWKFVAADLFCNNPVFEETTVGEGKKITISCNTYGAKIYYTVDGSDPASSTDVVGESTSWASSGQHLIRAIVKVSDGTNECSSESVTLLNKPVITLKEGESVIGEDTYTYDGTAKTPNVVVSITSGENTITAPTTPDATYTVTYSNNTNARTETSIPTVSIADAAEDDLWYIWNAEAVDFNIKPASVTLTSNSDTKTYDGSEKTVTGFTSSVDGLTFAESVSASGSGTNVGVYDVTFSGVTLNTTRDDTNNYVVTGTTNGTLTINAKAVTITASDAEKEYDGTPLTSDDFTATDLEEGDTHTFTVVMTEGSTITNVGTQPNVIATVDGTAVTTGEATAIGNYLVTTANGTLTVTKKILTITAGSDTKVYDGTELTNDSYTSVGLMTGDDIESVTITGSQIIVGTGDNVPSAAVVKNGETDVTTSYEIRYVNGSLIITPAAVTVIAVAKSKTYGEADPALTATVEGMVNNESSTLITYSLSRVEGEDVGEYTITPTGNAVQGNYSVSYETGTLTVNKKDVGIDWIHTEDLVYNGSSQTPTASATSLVGSDEIGVTVTGGATNAGSYTATASELTGEKAGNYKLPDPVPTSSFTINKAKLMAVNLENAVFVYNGEEQFVTIMSVTAGDGTVVTVSNVPSDEYDVSGNSATNAGTHTVTVTPKSPSTNYDTGVSQSTSFTIDKKSIGDGTDPATASGITIDITWNDNESIPYTVEVKDGESLLTAGTEGTEHAYSLSAIGDHDTKYYTVTITGANNYNGSFTAKYANVKFDSDGSPGAMWYGTFVAEADHATPTDMTPYIITSVADNTATAVALDYIPNGEPVVLMNPVEAKGFRVQPRNGGEDADVSDNKLVVQTDDAAISTATVYLLYKGEFVLNKAGTLKAGTVYLPVPAGGGSGARLRMSRGDSTGIGNIETIDSKSEAWYTLDGRCLSSKPTKKGLYLQGGQKVVVK